MAFDDLHGLQAMCRAGGFIVLWLWRCSKACIPASRDPAACCLTTCWVVYGALIDKALSPLCFILASPMRAFNSALNRVRGFQHSWQNLVAVRSFCCRRHRWLLAMLKKLSNRHCALFVVTMDSDQCLCLDDGACIGL